jgi:hypothetical protein
MIDNLKSFGVNVTPSYQLGITRLQIYIPPDKMSPKLNVLLVGLLDKNGYYIEHASSDGMSASKKMEVDEFVAIYEASRCLKSA